MVHLHYKPQAPAYAQQQMMPYMMPQMQMPQMGGGMMMTMMPVPMMTMQMMPVMMPSMNMNMGVGMNMGMGMNLGMGMGGGIGMQAAATPQINANVSLAGLLGNLGGNAGVQAAGAGGTNGMVNSAMEGLAEMTMLKMAAKSMDDQASAALVQRLQQSMVLTETLNRAAMAALLAGRNGAGAGLNFTPEQIEAARKALQPK